MYEFRTTPWEHQRQAMRRAWRRPGFAYLLEMGTGKSKIVIDEACLYHEEAMITGWVIMAPKGVYMNWVREGGELDTHMPERHRESAVSVVWQPGGGSQENQRQLERALRPGPGLRVLVMNTEAVQTAGLARTYLERFLRAHQCKWDLDESTFIKNPSAARTKFILSVAPLAAYRRIMTGSPVTRSPMDLFSQFEFLQPGCLGHRNFFSFRARYAVTRRVNFTPMHMREQGKRGRETTVIVAFRNLTDLTQRLEDHSFRVTKEECLDLPPKVYTQRDVELTAEQVRLYEEIRRDAISMIGDEGAFVSTDLVIKQMLRLQQVVCGHVPDDDGEMHDVPSRRVDTLMEAVSEVRGKAIIWCRFRREIDKIVAALEKGYGPEAVAQFHGGNVRTRADDAQRFMNDSDCRFMVASYAGGHGNTWIVATTVIYYANDFDLEHRMQSEDRAHRGGQTEHVTYVDLVTPGTVDEKIVRALRDKIDIASLVMGDAYREWLI